MDRIQIVTYVNETRNVLNLSVKEAILFLDGCSSHINDKYKANISSE